MISDLEKYASLLKMGGDKITARKVNFSRSVKVPRSLLSFLLLISRQCISIG
jgi:hypothetical protein